VIISDWKHDYITTAGTRHWATYPQPATLPSVPTDEQLSFAVDPFTGPASNRGTCNCFAEIFCGTACGAI
jgi:hypothetical protein